MWWCGQRLGPDRAVPKFAEPAAYAPQHLAERTFTFEAAVLRRKPSAWDTELDLIRAAAELTAAGRVAVQ